MDKFLITAFWTLSVLGAIFLGHEAAIMSHNLDREVANVKLQQCQKIIALNGKINSEMAKIGRVK